MVAGALRDARRHRRRDEARRRLPDGSVRAAGRGRPGRLAGHRAGAAPRSSATRAWRPRRCWSTWWRRAAWAARPAAASASMPGAERPVTGGPDGGLGRAARTPVRRLRRPPPGRRSGPVHAASRRTCSTFPTCPSPPSPRVPPRTSDAPESAAVAARPPSGSKMRRELAAAAMELFATQGVRGDDGRRDRGRGRGRPAHLLPALPLQGRGDLPGPRRHPDARRGGARRRTRRTSTRSTRCAAASRKSCGCTRPPRRSPWSATS